MFQIDDASKQWKWWLHLQPVVDKEQQGVVVESIGGKAVERPFLVGNSLLPSVNENSNQRAPDLLLPLPIAISFFPNKKLIIFITEETWVQL